MTSYEITEKEHEFSLYYLCLNALSIQSYADREAIVLNLGKITELRKQKLKVEILYDFIEF